MKKLLIIFIILQGTLFAQTTFNKLYSPYGNNINTPLGAYSIVSNNNSYIINTIGFDTVNNYYQSLNFYKIDSVGDATQLYNFSKAGYHYYQTHIKKANNGGYYAVGYMDSINSIEELTHFIVRFNQNMDTVRTTYIPAQDTIFEAYRNFCETSDNALVLIGDRYENSNNVNLMIKKMDTLGNQLWRKTINLANLGLAYDIFETYDKGFIISAYNFSYTTGIGDQLLIKTDSAGNQQWIKYLGGNQYDGGGNCALTKDSCILVAFGYSTYTYPYNDDWSARLNIIKYAPDGSVIWNRVYDTIRNHLGVCKIQVLPNNDFIVMGSYAARGINNFFPSFLFKFNTNGDSVWRKIYFNKNYSNDMNLLADNVLNADGSITACGWLNGDTLVPNQQIWLLKTDSMGYAPGPQNVGIIDLPFMHYGTLSVFPNPATTQAIISYPQLKTQGQLQIYNILGQKIYEENLNKNATQTLIDSKDYKKGLYKLVLKEKGEIRGYASLIIAN